MTTDALAKAKELIVRGRMLMANSADPFRERRNNEGYDLLTEAIKVLEAQPSALKDAPRSGKTNLHHCPKHGLEACDGVEDADHGCSSSDRFGYVWTKETEDRKREHQAQKEKTP